MTPDRSTVNRGPLGAPVLAVIGCVTLVASIGAWLAASALPDQYFEGGDSAWFGVWNALWDELGLLGLLAPLFATVLPASAWFDRHTGWRRLLIGGWVVWLSVGVFGWLTMVTTWPMDLGPGGGLLVLFAPVALLVGVVAVCFLAWNAASQRRRHDAQAAHLTSAST